MQMRRLRSSNDLFFYLYVLPLRDRVDCSEGPLCDPTGREKAVSGAESLSDPACDVGCEVVGGSCDPKGGGELTPLITNSQGQ